MGPVLRVLVLLCLWALTASGLAAPLDAFDGREFEVLPDPSGRMTLAQVRQRPADEWQPVSSPTPNFGFSRSAYWFRVTLQNPGILPQARVFEVQAPLLDWLDTYLLDADGRVLRHWALGDKRPFELRPVAHRHFALPLQWPPQASLQLYVRMQTHGSAQLPTRLWMPEAFEVERERTTLAHGIYFGVMFAMLVYNLFLLLSVRESSYFWYVLWVGALAAFVGSLTGLSFQFLWPTATHWNDTSIVFFLSLALGFGCLFTRSFLGLPGAVPRSARLLIGLAAGAWGFGAAALVLPYAPMVRGVAALAVALSAVGFVLGVMRLRDGFEPARYYLIAWSFVLFGGCVVALERAGLLPSNVWTENASQIGSAVEVLLLALALAARMNNERRLREQAQAETLHAQRKANEQLDRRVRERTAELERANVRLHEMSQTDGLTGLHNRRHLDEVLTLESQRASRGSGPLGLILIDIDHFKGVNDRHGHAAGDECLKQIASTIRTHARRSTDLVARYGGEEFCALMPAVGIDEAMAIAEHLRAQIEATLFEADGKQLRLTASLGVCCRVPASPGDAQRMLAEATPRCTNPNGQGATASRPRGRRVLVRVRR